MTGRCEWSGRLIDPRRPDRCSNDAVWLFDRHWWCDTHARFMFDRRPSAFNVPRDRPAHEDWRCAPWVPEVLEAHVARLRGRVLVPAQPALNLGGAA